MSKRYVFFRTHEGRPYRANDDKHAPVAILATIGESCFLNEEGNPTWKAFLMPRMKTPLRPMCVVLDPLGYELNDEDAWRIVWKALVFLCRQAPGKAIKPSALLTEADRLASEFFRKPQSPHVLVTSLSISKIPANEIAIHGCRISPLQSRDQFPLPSSLTRHPPPAFKAHLQSTQYKLIKVEVDGRSWHEATDKALTAVNLLRGIWSVLTTSGYWALSFPRPRRQPLGFIYIGPFHTLHSPDGKLVGDDLYWYEPDYVQDQRLFGADNRWGTIENHRQKLMAWMDPLDYRQELEDLLVRYAVALDQHNHDVTFLQMWSILERMTDTVGTNYDETIRRAT